MHTLAQLSPTSRTLLEGTWVQVDTGVGNPVTGILITSPPQGDCQVFTPEYLDTSPFPPEAITVLAHKTKRLWTTGTRQISTEQINN